MGEQRAVCPPLLLSHGVLPRGWGSLPLSCLTWSSVAATCVVAGFCEQDCGKPRRGDCQGARGVDDALHCHNSGDPDSRLAQR